MHLYLKDVNADDSSCQYIWLLILGEVMSLACCVTEQLSANCKLQIANYKLLIANCQLPIADCQLQIENCKFPIANCQLQIANCQFLIWVVDKYSAADINLSQLLNVIEVRVTTRGWISV